MGGGVFKKKKTRGVNKDSQVMMTGSSDSSDGRSLNGGSVNGGSTNGDTENSNDLLSPSIKPVSIKSAIIKNIPIIVPITKHNNKCEKLDITSELSQHLANLTSQQQTIDASAENVIRAQQSVNLENVLKTIQNLSRKMQ